MPNKLTLGFGRKCMFVNLSLLSTQDCQCVFNSVSIAFFCDDLVARIGQYYSGKDTVFFSSKHELFLGYSPKGKRYCQAVIGIYHSTWKKIMNSIVWCSFYRGEEQSVCFFFMSPTSHQSNYQKIIVKYLWL